VHEAVPAISAPPPEDEQEKKKEDAPMEVDTGTTAPPAEASEATSEAPAAIVS
jgi:hypothetical protein